MMVACGRASSFLALVLTHVGIVLRRHRLSYCFLAAMLLWASMANAKEEDTPVDKAVEQAELVVVGRVLGLADTKPAAQARRHLEVHRILVQRTLKGAEPSLSQIALRPNGARWDDGVAYVFLCPARRSQWRLVGGDPLCSGGKRR